MLLVWQGSVPQPVNECLEELCGGGRGGDTYWGGGRGVRGGEPKGGHPDVCGPRVKKKRKFEIRERVSSEREMKMEGKKEGG